MHQKSRIKIKVLLYECLPAWILFNSPASDHPLYIAVVTNWCGARQRSLKTLKTPKISRLNEICKGGFGRRVCLESID